MAAVAASEEGDCGGGGISTTRPVHSRTHNRQGTYYPLTTDIKTLTLMTLPLTSCIMQAFQAYLILVTYSSQMRNLVTCWVNYHPYYKTFLLIAHRKLLMKTLLVKKVVILLRARNDKLVTKKVKIGSRRILRKPTATLLLHLLLLFS